MKHRMCLSGWWYFWFWLDVVQILPIIKTAIKLNENVAVELAWYDLALDIVVDLVLMVFIILLVIRSFGMKLKDLDKPWLKEYNVSLSFSSLPSVILPGKWLYLPVALLQT